MNKNQELVEKFLKRDLEGTKPFAAFNDDCKESIKAADAKRLREEACLQERYEKYGRDTVASSERTSPADDYIRARERAKKRLEELKMTYTQACSIAIESGVLRCQVPVEDKNCGSDASIKVAERIFFFSEKSFSIPEEFMGKDPIECEAFADWIIQTMIMKGNFFVWVVLQDELNS